MSLLKEQLSKVATRLNELESHPSALIKDALLAEVIELYDVIKNTTPQAAVDIEEAPTPAASIEPEAHALLEEEKEVQPSAIQAQKPIVQPPVSPATPAPAAVSSQTPESLSAQAASTPEPVAKKEPLIGKEEAQATNDAETRAAQLSKKPIQNLRSEIPLNEKFGIIRNLFNGNASDFGDAVLKLNNAANEQEMTHYLQLLSQRFSWDTSSESYLNFVGYVERKMMSLETPDTDSKS